MDKSINHLLADSQVEHPEEHIWLGACGGVGSAGERRVLVCALLHHIRGGVTAYCG